MPITLPVKAELIKGDYKNDERNDWVVTQGPSSENVAKLSMYRHKDSNRVVIEIDATDADLEVFILNTVVQLLLVIPGARPVIKSSTVKFEETMTAFPKANLFGFNGYGFDCYFDVSKEDRKSLYGHHYDIYRPIQRWYLRER